MTFNLAVFFSLSISIAAIIIGIRIRKISPDYYWFALLLWLAFINEVISYLVVRAGHYNTLNNNIYFLVESLVICCQFRAWGLFRRYRFLFPTIIGALIIFWTSEVIFISGINAPISYFRVFYSFTLALMSANMISRIVANETNNLLRNPVFLICMAFVVYYTYAVIVDVFWIYGLNLSLQFIKNLTAIMMYINLVCNLVFALVALMIPGKRQYSAQF